MAILIVGFVNFAWFAPVRGLHAETLWYRLSVGPDLSDRFIYPGDASRPFLMLPFGIASLVPGHSFIAVNLVAAAFAVAVGLMAYVVAISVFRLERPFAALAGIVTVTLGADLSSTLFSMSVLWQAALCCLVALYLLGRVVDRRASLTLVVPAAILLLVALFTYEAVAPAVGMIAVFVVAASRRRRPLRRVVTLAAAAVPLILFAAFNATRYAGGEVSYQSAKFRSPSAETVTLSVVGWLGRLVSSWSWPSPWLEGWFSRCQEGAIGQVIVPLTVVVIVLGLFAFSVLLPGLREWRDDERRECIGPKQRPWYATLFGRARRHRLPLAASFVAASYLPYLFVVDGNGDWRTHILAAPWIGITVAAAIRLSFFTGTAILVLVMLAAVSGSAALLLGQLEIAVRWDRVRTVMQGVVDIAPNATSSDTIAVVGLTRPLTGMCRVDDGVNPFGDAYWFGEQLKIFYPDSPPLGVLTEAGLAGSGRVFLLRFDDNGVMLSAEVIGSGRFKSDLDSPSVMRELERGLNSRP